MAEEVNITVKVTDNASRTLDGISKEFSNAATQTKTTGTAMQNLSTKFMELNAKVELAKTAAAMLGGAYKALVGDTQEYAKTVRELSLITGSGAEETSRLIEFTDDFGISLGELETAARGAATKGIVLTTDALAKMSDEYLALGSQQEKNTYLIDNFGRSGLKMAKAMEQGSDAILSQAAAISQNLLMTEAQLAEAEKLRIAEDNLNDSLAGVGRTIGNALIPQLAKAAEAMNLLLNWDNLINAALGEQMTKVTLTSTSYDDYIAQLTKAAEAAGYVIKETNGEYQAFEKVTGGTLVLSNNLKVLSSFEWMAAQASAKMAEAQTTATVANSAATKTALGLASAFSAAAGDAGLAASSAHEMAGAADRLALAEGNLKTAQDNLATAQANWRDGAGGQIAGMLETAGLKADDMVPALQALDERFGTNETAAFQTTEQMKKLVAEYAESGKIDLFKKGLEELENTFMPLNEDIKESTALVKELQMKMDALAKTYYVRLRMVDETGSGGGEGGGGSVLYPDLNDEITDPGYDGPRAAGGPVRTGKRYLVGENGPEMFEAASDGQIVNNWSLTINEAGSRGNVVSDFAIMRSLAGA